MLSYLRSMEKKREMIIAQKALSEIARREGISMEEVRMSMKKAIEAAYNSPDHQVKARLSEIPKVGEIPTPEEVIIWGSKLLLAKRPH